MARRKSSNLNCIQQIHISGFNEKTKNQIKLEMFEKGLEARYCGKNQTFYMYKR